MPRATTPISCPVVVFGPDHRPRGHRGGWPCPGGIRAAGDPAQHRRQRSGILPLAPRPPRRGTACFRGGPQPGRWRSGLFVSLRRSATDGAFLGVLVDGVRQSTFIDYWNHAVPDRDAAISLIREDGSILARRPAVDPEERPRLPRARCWSGPSVPAPSAWCCGAPPWSMASRRLVAIRRLGHFPVYIGHGVPRAAALAPWHHRLLVYGGFAVAVAAALSSLALLARRQARGAARPECQPRTARGGADGRDPGRGSQAAPAGAGGRPPFEERARRGAGHAPADPEGGCRRLCRCGRGARVGPGAGADAAGGGPLAGASLDALLRAELAPFVAPDATWPGPGRSWKGRRSAAAALVQPLAMTVHELATNAVKHGALSALGGRVGCRGASPTLWPRRGPRRAIGWWAIGLCGRQAGGRQAGAGWAETGGPALAGPPARRGFGSRVMESVVRGQLGGSLACSWEAPGLTCDIDLPLATSGDECCNGRGCRCSMNRRAPAPWTPAPYAGQVGYDPEPERAWCAASYRGPCCCGGPGCYGGLSRARHGVVIAASSAAGYRLFHGSSGPRPDRRLATAPPAPPQAHPLRPGPARRQAVRGLHRTAARRPVPRLRRLVTMLLWTLLCIPVQAVLLALPGHAKSRFPVFYHRVAAWLIGLKVQVVGTPCRDRPVLFVSNHSSWLDIPVLGGVLEAAFVAKTEVGTMAGDPHPRAARAHRLRQPQPQRDRAGGQGDARPDGRRRQPDPVPRRHQQRRHAGAAVPLPSSPSPTGRG